MALYHNFRSVYPNANVPSTLDKTIPDANEQEAVGQVDETAPKVVPNKQAIWKWLIAIFVIIVIMNVGGKFNG